MATEKKNKDELFAVGNFTLQIQESRLTSYILNDGTRVFLQQEILSFIYEQKAGQPQPDLPADELYKHVNVVKAYLPLFFIERRIKTPILFTADNVTLAGVRVEDIEIVFRAFIKSRHLNKLPRGYIKIAGLAEQYFFQLKK